MSSHHIIREKQEPALVLHDLHQVNTEYLGQLLEWSPTVVALEQCLEAVDLEGIKIDYAIVTINHEDKWRNNLQQGPITFVTTTKPAIADGIELLRNKGHDAVNIVGNQVEINAFKELVHMQMMADIALIQSNQKIFLHHSDSFKKWYPKGETIQVLPLKDDLSLTSLGFESNMVQIIDQAHELVTSMDGVIELTSKKTSFLIVENL